MENLTRSRTFQPLMETVAYDYNARFNMFSHLPNPNIMIAQAGDRNATFANILQDPHVSSCVQTRKCGLTAYEFEVQSTNEEIKSFCDWVLSTIDVKKLIDNITDAVLYGYSVIEVNYAYSDYDNRTVVVPATLHQKPFYWFVFDPYNVCRFVPPDNPAGVLLPPNKFIITQHKPTYTNPYGEALLSNCLWSVVFKKTNVSTWLKFIEKFGMPHFVGKTTATDDVAYGNMLDQLNGLIQEASAVINTEDDIVSLNSTNTASSKIYTDLIDFCNSEISKAILSETLTTEIGSTGSYAAGKVHENVLYNVIDSDKKLAEKGINDLLGWVVRFNFENVTPEEMPHFILFPPDDVDASLANVTDVLTKNNQIRFTKKFYMERFGFDDDEFELVENQPQAQFAENSESNENNNINRQDLKKEINTQSLVDAVADSEIEATAKEIDEYIKQLLEVFNKFNSYDEAINNVSKIFKSLDTENIENLVIRILTENRIIGMKAKEQ